jgi:methylthioribulose-1-phosphate dehydratase
LGYHDTLRIPVIENTPHEEDLTESLEEAMDKYPDTYAVLVRRHGVYVWGETVHKAKTQAERSVSFLMTLLCVLTALQSRLSLSISGRDEEAGTALAE